MVELHRSCHRCSAQLSSWVLLGLFGPLTLAKADARAAAVLVDELDAGHLKEHCNSLRPRAKPVSYRFFLGALAV